MPDDLGASPHELDTVARTLYGECRGEDLEGQEAVAWVIRNRAEWRPPAWWGSHLVEVCMKPEQFSCWNKGDPNYWLCVHLSQDDLIYQRLYEVARVVMAGEVSDPTKHSDHYERVGTGAAWAKNRSVAAIIGNHAFYALGPSG